MHCTRSLLVVGAMVFIALIVLIIHWIARSCLYSCTVDRLLSLRTMRQRSPYLTSRHMGMTAMIAALTSFMRNGADIVTACEEVSGQSFASKEITLRRAINMVQATRDGSEENSQLMRAAHHIHAAYRLSARSGCEMVKCLEAVRASMRQQTRLDELRRQAFSMPLATIRLLTWLPVLSIALGELIGAKTLRFLFTSLPGAACLAVGASLYALGLVWTRSLTRTLRALKDEDSALIMTSKRTLR